MSIEENKTLALAVEEAWERGDLDSLDGYFAPDVISHASVPFLPPGLEGWKEAHRQMKAAVPDRRVEVLDVIAEGDKVAIRARLTGTNLGGFPWIDLSPNGNRIDMTFITIYRMENGRIAECWAVNDMGTLVRQVGADLDLIKRRTVRGGWPALGSQ